MQYCIKSLQVLWCFKVHSTLSALVLRFALVIG